MGECGFLSRLYAYWGAKQIERSSSIIVNAADVSARAVTLAEGTISDALAETKLEWVFSTR